MASGVGREAAVRQPQLFMTITNVYIDGVNLYYGCLRGTPFRWLDVARLSSLLLPRDHRIHRIRYFTARVGEQSAG